MKTLYSISEQVIIGLIMIIYYINQYNNVYKVYYHFKINKIIYKRFSTILNGIKDVTNISLTINYYSKPLERGRYIGDNLK